MTTATYCIPVIHEAVPSASTAPTGETTVDLWHRLLDEIDADVAQRSYASYDMVVDKFLRLRMIAVVTQDGGRFNEVLRGFLRQHKIKSLLVSMVNHRVRPI